MPHFPFPGNGAGGSSGSLQGEEPPRHQVCGEVTGLHHVASRGHVVGLCHLLQIRWKPQEGCQLIQRLRCPEGVSLLQGQRQKPGGSVAVITLLFTQELFQVHFLSTHWKTDTGSGIKAHAGSKGHPLYPQGHGSLVAALLRKTNGGPSRQTPSPPLL